MEAKEPPEGIEYDEDHVARLNEELKRRTIARVNRPDPVAGVIRASASRQPDQAG